MLVSYSKIISVKNNLLKDFSVYPNPVQDNLNINFYAEVENEYHINVYNTSSQIVYSENLQITKGYNNCNISIFNNLNSGIYFLIVNDAQGNMIKKEKIIK